jgi:hypothetical protein
MGYMKEEYKDKPGELSGYGLYLFLQKKGVTPGIALETCIEMGMDFRPKGSPPVQRAKEKLDDKRKGFGRA